ncbi:MAG: hypothetical protein FJ148_08215 [Deltaproteobacteria bacterium]|nr:hypothetical protein [Deltaproteobacteria bacterium]
MYLSFYGLGEKPFGQTPDPKFLYWNDGYRETIANLRYGIEERKGFVTMIGEAGTGKTTLLRKLLDDLGPDVVSVFLFNPNATFEEILEYTLGELGIPAPAGRKLAMLQRLNEFLLAAFQEGKNTILLIDEAQDLETEVLESLRLLSNLETSKDKILQIVLSGQPELAARLAQPNLRQLKQRIAVRCRLEPLRREELPHYLAARLTVAGGRPDLFAPAALDPIWSFAQGIPRLVNAVCDNALLVGYALGRQTIDAAVIDEVVADLRRIDAPLVLPVGDPPAAVEPAPSVAAVPTRAEAPADARALAEAGPAAPVVGPSEAPTTPGRPIAPPGPQAAARSGASRPVSTTQPSRPRSRQAAGFVVAVGVILAVAAIATFAASRWDEIRPRVRALLAEPANDTADRTVQASQADPPPAVPPVAASAPVVANPPPPNLAAAAQAAPEAAPAAAPVAPEAPPSALASAPRGADAPGGGAIAASPPATVGPALSSDQAPGGPVPGAPPDPVAGATALRAAGDSRGVVGGADVLSAARLAPQDLQPRQRTERGGRRVQVQLGDTLMNLAAREYGSSTYTALDVVRSANPSIRDVDRIIAGSEIVFPDPGPGARVSGRGEDLVVLVGTSPALAQAQDLQSLASARYGLPADLEPIPLGDGRNLYRVSVRNLVGQAQARAIAEELGSILRDPG